MIIVIRLSATLLAGQRFWLLPLAPALWLALQAILLVSGRLPTPEPVSAQNTLIGVPAMALAAFLGVRIIAGEMDERCLEIAYTIPGGARRVWFGKLIASSLLVLASLALAAPLTFVFFTPFPVAQTVYGAAQGAAFCLTVAMGLGTLFRSEAGGALGTVTLLGLIATRGGLTQTRISPFWNPLTLQGADPDQLIAMAIQNRIGTALVIAAIVALTFARAELREKMLSG